MKTSVLLAILIVLGAYRAPADVPPPSATSPAQPVATTPKQTPAGGALQDQINQQNKNNQQKQSYRKLESAMMRQQTNLNKQIENESSAKPAVAKIRPYKMGASQGVKKNGKHGKQPGS